MGCERRGSRVVASREGAGARGATAARRGENKLEAATRERHVRSRPAGREDRRASIAESGARGRSDAREAAQLPDTKAPRGVRPLDSAQAVVCAKQLRYTRRLAGAHRLAVAVAGRLCATAVAACRAIHLCAWARGRGRARARGHPVPLCGSTPSAGLGRRRRRGRGRRRTAKCYALALPREGVHHRRCRVELPREAPGPQRGPPCTRRCSRSEGRRAGTRVTAGPKAARRKRRGRQFRVAAEVF